MTVRTFFISKFKCKNNECPTLSSTLPVYWGNVLDCCVQMKSAHPKSLIVWSYAFYLALFYYFKICSRMERCVCISGLSNTKSNERRRFCWYTRCYPSTTWWTKITHNRGYYLVGKYKKCQLSLLKTWKTWVNRRSFYPGR